MNAGELAAADAAFGTDLYARLAGPGNLVFSPASIAAALRMALIGARGETATELAHVLHLPGEAGSLAGVARNASAALAGFRAGRDLTLRTVNTAWVDQAVVVRRSFLDQPVEVAEADFRHQPDAARRQVNAAIAEQTAGKVTDLIAPGLISDLTRLILVSAIYLKARWEHEFPAADTRKDAFYPERSGPAQADMMRLRATLAYVQGDGYQAVLLPYRGGPAALAVVLPDGPLSRFALADHGGLATIVHGLLRAGECQVDLRLPRFTITAGFLLGDTLRALGAATAFGADADLSGIADGERLAVSEVVHQAFIDVDEQGTEAAAATAMAIAAMALRAPRRPVVLTADRPFLFAVVETGSGLPLFLGQLTRP
ncbi:MAG TPA: serpin family protein [Trebonia sp.]|jgi:serpin B|nr:serpin family protein [Trebonia sp.]